MKNQTQTTSTTQDPSFDQVPTFPLSFLQETASAAYDALYEHLKHWEASEDVLNVLQATCSLYANVIFVMEHEGKANAALNEVISADVLNAISGITELGGKIHLVTSLNQPGDVLAAMSRADETK